MGQRARELHTMSRNIFLFLSCLFAGLLGGCQVHLLSSSDGCESQLFIEDGVLYLGCEEPDQSPVINGGAPCLALHLLQFAVRASAGGAWWRPSG